MIATVWFDPPATPPTPEAAAPSAPAGDDEAAAIAALPSTPASGPATARAKAGLGLYVASVRHHYR